MPVFTAEDHLCRDLWLQPLTQLTREGRGPFFLMSALKTFPRKPITGEWVRLILHVMSGCTKTQDDRDGVVMRDWRFRPQWDERLLFFVSHSCHYVVTLRYKPRGAGAGCWQLSILQTTQSSITVLRSASISTHSIRRHQSTLFMHKSTYAHSWPEHMQVWIYNRSHGTPAYITSYSSGNLCSFKKHWLVSMLFLNIIYSSNHIFTKVYFAIHSTIILTDSNALVRWLWITGGAGLVLLGLVQWFV